MAKHDEISSTEKLLNVIRAKNRTEPEVPETEVAQEDLKQRKPLIAAKISFKKKVTIGVDIGAGRLRLVAVNQTGDKTPELLNYASIPYDPEVPKSSPGFPQFLKAAIRNFCGTSKKFQIWSVISSARVETRFVRIPKVSAKQIANAVYWTYKKEVNFNDAADIFDFEVLGEAEDRGARKLEVVAYSAPRHEINELRNIFLKSTYPLTGISIVPFAMQNFLRSQWTNIDAGNICNLFIGKDWSRIAIFSAGDLILSREIKSGIQSIVESIRENLGTSGEGPAAEPGSAEERTGFEAGQEKRSYYNGEKAQQIFNRLIQEPAVGETLADTDAGERKAFEMIMPALDRIVRQVERTIQHYTLKYKNEKINKIYISGRISANQQILDYIGDQLDLPIEVIDPFNIGMSLSDNFSLPTALTERGLFTPAIGIALSSNMLTPNFIHTYKDKEEITSAARIKRIAAAAAFIFVLICAGTYYWQSRLISYKKTESAQLQRQVDRQIPYVDENLILQMVSQVKKDKKALERYSQKSIGIGLVSVISKSTPSNIRLLRLTADFGDMAEEKKPNDEKGTVQKRLTAQKRLTLEGIIIGDRLTFESALAEYMVQLKKSPLFGGASVQKRTVEQIDQKEVMKFTAELHLI